MHCALVFIFKCKNVSFYLSLRAVSQGVPQACFERNNSGEIPPASKNPLTVKRPQNGRPSAQCMTVRLII